MYLRGYIMYNCSRGDLFMDFAYKLRYTVFCDYVNNNVKVTALCKKYGLSRKWFYKFRKRFLIMGFEGLRDKARAKPIMPHTLAIDKKIDILDYLYKDPTHGAKRISMNLALLGPRISEGCIYNFLVKEDMNTKRKRILWAESQGRHILTDKQKVYIAAQDRHIETTYPGELISVDTFTVSIKNLGKIWQYTACDTYSSYGWAKVYKDRTSDNTVDFLKNHLLNKLPKGKIKRILTDQGSEFYSARTNKKVLCLDELCKRYKIMHSVTKVAHPWTNGYAERLNRTIWDEFYLCRLSKEFNNLADLQKELDNFMLEYNFKRIHTGYKLREKGYKYPYEAFCEDEDGLNLDVKCYHVR